MKKQALNKRLRSKILTVKDSDIMKHVRFKVTRARESKNKNGRCMWTDVDIRIVRIIIPAIPILLLKNSFLMS